MKLFNPFSISWRSSLRLSRSSVTPSFSILSVAYKALALQDHSLHRMESERSRKTTGSYWISKLNRGIIPNNLRDTHIHGYQLQQRWRNVGHRRWVAGHSVTTRTTCMEEILGDKGSNNITQGKGSVALATRGRITMKNLVLFFGSLGLRRTVSAHLEWCQSL